MLFWKIIHFNEKKILLTITREITKFIAVNH
jgi:hypothetical protein